MLGGMSWESTASYYKAINEGINEKLGGTKKEKRAQKRIMNKSEKIRKREARQLEREKRTGSKEGKGIIGKIRKKVIGMTQKATTKKINRNIDKLTDKQAFNTARRYVPGKTYTKGGKVYSEKTGKTKKKTTASDQDEGKTKKKTTTYSQYPEGYLKKEGPKKVTSDFKDKNKNGIDDRQE